MRPSTAVSRCNALFAVLLAFAPGCAEWQQPGEDLGARLGADARYLRTISGRLVYVERHGEDHGAPPVLLVHGFASNHDVWDTLEPALRAGRRTINIDLPGFGWSERVPGDYSPAAIARDLVSVLDALGAQTVDVVAHSWGSSVSLALAMEHPERVRRVVLVSAFIYDEQIPPFFRVARMPVMGEALFSAFYRERPEDRFPLAFVDESIVSQDVVEAIERSLDRPGTARAALAAVRGMCLLQLERRYRTVQQPTLLLWGQQDNVARLRFGERLAHDLPHARLQVLPQSGHFPMLEDPSHTREAILAYLDAPTPPVPDLQGVAPVTVVRPDAAPVSPPTSPPPAAPITEPTPQAAP